MLPGANRATTTWHVAVNACMAGCKPQYMPILIAMTKAMRRSNFRRTLQSTHACVPYPWLNGPVARQLGISSGQGEINAQANTSLSRFLALALMNLAGYYVGQNRMGTFGYLQPWCLVEDEEACRRVGWQTSNQQQGLDINDNSVAVHQSRHSDDRARGQYPEGRRGNTPSTSISATSSAQRAAKRPRHPSGTTLPSLGEGAGVGLLNTWTFTRIGKIEDKTQAELKQILKAGQGNITVTLSLSSWTTAIYSVRSAATENDAYYSLSGQRIERSALPLSSRKNPTHGIYIKNGKKVIL